MGRNGLADTGWSAEEVAQLAGGAWLVAPEAADWRTRGVCAEPTQFAPGQMLLARAGDAGLREAVVARLAPRAAGIIAEDGSACVRSGVPVLEVPDLRQAVTALAGAARLAFKGTVLAVTGSVGKTTTVAMADHVLSGMAASDCSRTSANSLYSIGWNLVSMRRDVDFWVQEMAAGRMESCSHLVRPDVAIVTALAPAHLQSFGTLDNIARQKAKIYLGMKPGGIAVINGDMPQSHVFEEAAFAAGLKVLHFGRSPACDAQLRACDEKTVSAIILDKEYVFALGAAGEHMAMNAVAVLAAVASLGLDVATAARQFAGFQPLAGRGKRSSVSFEGKQIEIWDDSYNANPGSMRAALQTLQRAVTVPAASRVLVLGDMLELGPDTGKLHLSLAKDIRAAAPDRVLLCGPLMKVLADSLLNEVKGRWFPDVEALQAALSPWIHAGDVVLVKASRGIRLEGIVKLLASRPQHIPLGRPQRGVVTVSAKPATAPAPRPFQRSVLPAIDARCALSLLVSGSSGQAHELLFEKAPSRRLPPASLTKLMTVLVMLDLMKKYQIPLTDYLTIDAIDKAAGSGRNIGTSEKISLRDALANLLLSSSNITANAVARSFGDLASQSAAGTEGAAGAGGTQRFIAAMQNKAGQLGMHDTCFWNASGLPARGQVTSAADMVRLMVAVLDYPEIAATWGNASHVMQVQGARPREQKINSTLKVLNDYDVIGGKTGTLLPGCYHAALLSRAPDGGRIITVVLQAPDPLSLYTDLRTILDAVKRGRDWPGAD